MWAFRFESWAALLPAVGARSVMDYLEMVSVATTEAEVGTDALGTEAERAARVIYHLLVQLVGGRALGIVRRTPRGNGLLAWYRLKKEFEDDGGHRSVALLMGLLSPEWSQNLTAKQFADTLDEWETEVELYEKQTNELVTGPVKVAVVMRNAPPEVQAALRMQLPSIKDDYPAMRSAFTFLGRGLTE